MAHTDLKDLLRKRWYVVALVLAFAGALVYFVSSQDASPLEVLKRYNQYAYHIILVWTFLEGETIVILAGMFSGELGLDPWLIALCAFGGSFCSDQVMFNLGKYKGEAVLRYFPRLAANVDKAARLFKKYDTLLILGFRFVYGVRNVTPILLGISGVSHAKFLTLNVIGAGVWALSFSFGGLYVGQAFMKIMGIVGHGIFYAILAALAGAALVWRVRSRREAAREIVAGNEPPVSEAASAETRSEEDLRATALSAGRF